MADNALLHAIMESPDDDGPRLAYADWLDENGQSERAELLRLHCWLVATCCEPEGHPERALWQARLVELLRQGVRPCVPQRAVTVGNNLDMTFAWIPPGTFLMGSPQGEEEEFGADPVGFWHNCIPLSLISHGDETQHQVILTKGFHLGVDEVTQAQWQAVMDSNPSRFNGSDRPVERVSWDDCQEFCKRLSQKIGKRFRLPTEAEWEYACRAGTTTPFSFGSIFSWDQANFAEGFFTSLVREIFSRGGTTPVGTFPSNAWGLFDMHGNVREWCQDWYRDVYPTEEVSDPKGPDSGWGRVLRGGDWHGYPYSCRSACRLKLPPDIRGHDCGCRVCLCLD